MFKCFMNRNHNTMNACASASVSSSACSCSENNSAAMALVRILDTVMAVSIFVIVELISIISLIIPEKYIKRPKTVLVQ